MTDKIRLRDRRAPGWYWSQNEVIDIYAAKIGAVALSVYSVLCRCVRSGQECKLSHRFIGSKLAISTKTVSRSIQSLEDARMIAKLSGKDAGDENTYVLLELKPLYEGRTESPTLFDVQGTQESNPSDTGDLGGRTPVSDNNRKKDCKDSKTNTPPDGGDQEPSQRDFTDRISEAYLAATKKKLEWSGRAFKVLATERARFHSWSWADWIKAFENWSQSDTINPAELPEFLIPKLPRYLAGPLAFGGLKSQGQRNEQRKTFAEQTTSNIDSATAEVDRRLEKRYAAAAGEGDKQNVVIDAEDHAL